MSEELTYKRLRDLAREEKVQPGLVALPPEFYSSLPRAATLWHSSMMMMSHQAFSR